MPKTIHEGGGNRVKSRILEVFQDEVAGHIFIFIYPCFTNKEDWRHSRVR